MNDYTEQDHEALTRGENEMTDTAHAAHASLADELRSESAEMRTEAQADLLVCASAVIDALLAEVSEHKAVYQLGVAAGAKMVQFRDAHVEKELKLIPMDMLWQIGLRLDRVLAQAGKKSQLGLKKARRLVAEMYDEALKELG